ncbi:TonB-dependent receptor [Mucilaginibacter gynuensis]|uniref:TonB-dependent receptor n=1 Tax=Mucilaginibacter gynuensis TaxID=1302236 RepID=A0ABP8H905_9SPHI
MTPKRAIIIIYCLICSATAFAQTNYGVKGLVADTSSNISLDKATVCVLNAKDSILLKYSYTDKGAFNIDKLQPGKYMLMVTYPDYADFVETFTLDPDHPLKDFNNIGMILRSKLLNEVIIKARAVAIKIKGDTTEFNAAAYITQKNAKVEDLLKQLQGMKIDQRGKITFQGQAIDKVLVDGEEFFGDDPLLVTRNLRADMVSKVQVYDQKSEEAKLKGIDDGVKIKTINIQLTEDKRKGVFGKAEGDYGTGKYNTGQLMVNKFTTKEKIAAFGSFSNTGKVGLNGDDNNKYGGGDYNNGNGSYDGVGLPLSRNAGAFYSNKWNKDKQSINTSYKIGSFNVDGEGSSFTQNNLPGNFNTSNRNNTFHRYSFNQSLSGTFNSQIDSTSDINTRFGAYNTNGKSDGKSNTTTLRGNGVLQNTSDNATFGDYDHNSLSGSVYYTKRLKKKGRYISLNAYGAASKGNNNNNLNTTLKYYNEQGTLDSTSLIDQHKPGTFKSNDYGAGVSYGEPLSKKITVSAGYNVSSNVSHNSQLSFNKSAANRYDALDSLFSNDLRVTNQSGGYSVGMSYSGTGTYFSIGTNVARVNSKQADLFADTVLSRKFVNWSPNAYFSHQLSKAASINFNYYGFSGQPSFNQLQPLRQNSDPLNITIGNPALKSSFSNRFSANYRLYQPTLDRGINLNGSYGNTYNAIVYNRTTDSAGVNTLQYVNIDKKPTSWNIYSEVYGHFPKLDFIVSINMSVNGNTQFNYVNNQLNTSKSVTYTPQINIWKNKTNYSYFFDFGLNYVVNSSSLQQINNNSRGFLTNAGFSFKLPHGFFVNSDARYSYTAKNKVFDRDFSRYLINSTIGKTFLKDESLKISIMGNDLLNQNTGYSRNGNADNFTEERNTTIRRYFLFSVTWDFSKFGKSLQPVPQP